MTVNYLFIEYYTLVKKTEQLPDLRVVKQYVDEVFCYMKYAHCCGLSA